MKTKKGSQRKTPQTTKAASTHRWLPLLLIAAGTLVYLNSFAGVFLFDDDRHIVNNPHVQKLWPITEVLAYGRRPVVNLTLAINYAIGQLDPWGYHLVNLAIHLLAGLVLYGIVRRTLLRQQFGDAIRRAAPWLACCVALLWVVHPLQTQSVTYVVQRGEALMGLFYLLTLYCVLRGAAARQPIGWYLAAVVACALGMGSKAVMISAPLVVLLYDRVFLTQSWRQTFQRRWGLYLGLAATWGVLLLCGVVQGVFNPPADAEPTVGFGYKGVTPSEYAATQPGVILHYLRLSLVPCPLCLDYDWPVAEGAAAIVLPGVVLAALVGVTIWALVRMPWLGFLGVWFLVILAPTSSVVPIRDIAFEHRMYLPLAAVVMVAVTLIWAISHRALREARKANALVTILAIVIMIVFGFLTVRRNGDYHSELAMWSRIVEQRPNNPRAHYNLARALAEDGQHDSAAAHYQQAIGLAPDFTDAYVGLGLELAGQGDAEQAVQDYLTALELEGGSFEAHNNLAAALIRLGRFDQAIEHAGQAVQLRPDSAEAHNNLGLALSSRGDVEAAIEQFEIALQLSPDSAGTHRNLAEALFRAGRIQQAERHFLEALRLQPDSSDAHNGLAIVLAQQGNLDQALVHFEQAVQLNPANAEAHSNLGRALMMLGRPDEALDAGRRAVEVRPADPALRCNLARVLVRCGQTQEAIGQYVEALKIDSANPNVHYELGVLLAGLGELETAEQALREALRLQPDHALARDALEAVRAQRGQTPP